MEATNTIEVAPTLAQLIERWDNVERVLDKMPEHEREHHWDMSTWGEQNECGTVACAAGHCGLDPWFRDRDFKLDFKEDGDYEISDVETFFGVEGSKRIFFNAQARPVSTVLDEVRTYVRELKTLEAATKNLTLPEIGAAWPEQGGVFAGACVGSDGAPYLLIVGPENEHHLTWDAAKTWAADLSVGELRGFQLPDRRDGTALFERVRSLFSWSWYWLSEQRESDGGYAWVQHFSDGNQIYDHKGLGYRARAVRRVPIP